MATTVNTVTLSDEVIQAASMIGKLVTVEGYGGGQFYVHSVEGRDFYAFQSDVQAITIDPAMTPLDRIHQTTAHLLPTWAKVGEGYGFDAPLTRVRPGVSLVKSWV